MEKKAGRPKTDNPRIIKNFRFTQDELIQIKDCAERLKTSQTKALVEGIKLLRTSLNKGGIL